MSLGKKDDKSSLRHYSLPKSVTVSWKSVSVKAKRTSLADSFKLTKQQNPKYDSIVNDADGIAEPGRMLGIIGASGSGKTTLLNALSFRQKNNFLVQGNIMLNGHACDATQMALVSSYIQQDFLFFGLLTVEEHLTFHAMLRMDEKIPKSTKILRVRQVLREFNLEDCAKVRIGTTGRDKGISGGEMRRLSIASEILTDPQVLFCDEPTSGLDSFMASSVVYHLQKLSKSGKTIICTIHQPSSELFSVFDDICIFAQSRVAYFGPRESALTYFSKSLNKTCPTYTNPSDFYMEVLGTDVNNIQYNKSVIASHCNTFRTSEIHEKLMNKIENFKDEKIQVPDNYRQYKSSWFTQLLHLIQRSFYTYYRNTKVIINGFTVSCVTAILGGLIYYNSSENINGTCQFDHNMALNLQLALFYSMSVVYIICILSSTMAFPLELPIYFREHASLVYRTETYYIAKVLVEVGMTLFLPIVHSVTYYQMAGLGCDTQNFLFFVFVEILTSNCAYSLGHVISILAGDVYMSISCAAPMIALQMLFSRFFLSRASHNAPEAVLNLKYLSAFYYIYDLMMINQYEPIKELHCKDSVLSVCLRDGNALLETAKVDKKNKMKFVGVLILLSITLRLLALTILWVKSRRTPLRIKSLLSKGISYLWA